MTKLCVVLLIINFCYGKSTDELYRPCPNLDLGCIRAFSGQHSHCKPANPPFQDIYDIPILDIPFPHANYIFTWHNARVTGFKNTHISEFSVNSITNEVVIELQFNHVLQDSQNTTHTHFRRGKEPLVLTDYFGITYLSMTVRAIVPFDKIKGIQWLERRVQETVVVIDSPILMGRDFFNPDPDVQANLKQYLGRIDISIDEAVVVVGPYYFDLYFNSNICEVKAPTEKDVVYKVYPRYLGYDLYL